MCSGGHDGCASRWNEEAATLETIEQRVAFDPERDTVRHARDKLTDLQLEATDGSSAQAIVKIIIRLSLSLLVPRQHEKMFACYWISSDSISATKRW